MARRFMKGERSGHTLETTELVDQMYFKLVAAKDRDWRNRAHFTLFRIEPCAATSSTALEELEDLLPADSNKVELALTVDGLLDADPAGLGSRRRSQGFYATY